MRSKIPFPTRLIPEAIARKELALISRLYPNAKSALNYRNPFHMLVATILSAQTNDARVNQVMPSLSKRFPTPDRLGKARIVDVERLIHPIGFYRTKAVSIVMMARELVDRHRGVVPDRRAELEALPGVGRKTASVVLAGAFGRNALVVERHVFRVAHRMGLTLGEKPFDVEQDLARLLPRRMWRRATHQFISHGRQLCVAPIPHCGICPIRSLCPTPRLILRFTTVNVQRVAGLYATARR